MFARPSSYFISAVSHGPDAIRLNTGNILTIINQLMRADSILPYTQ